MINAILTDIEGTTSSISFVKEVLFPYAAEQLPTYLRDNLEQDQVKDAMRDAAAEAGLDPSDTEAIIAQLLSWIAEDRKITALKTLQGLVWEAGYRRGDYRAHIYPDATRKLREWQAEGLPIYIYSSGSEYAQRLFFGHSEDGDLLHLFSGFFDTRIGAKRETDSYLKIAEAIECPAAEILFLSDIREELDAASDAGMKTCLLWREDAAEPDCSHPVARDFSDITL